MDVDAERVAIDNEQREIQAYLNHPLSQLVFKDNEEQQNLLIELLCNRTIVDVPTFFQHFEAIGHLRGLRRSQGILQDKLEEIETQLKNLPN